MKKRISSEYHDCLAFYKWAQYHPILKEYLFKIVNEGKRNATSGFYLKMIGLRAGIPDYCLPVPNKRWHSLWIEMKTLEEKDKPRRANQDEWIAKLNKIGHYATYCYGAHDAIRMTEDYLNNKI